MTMYQKKLVRASETRSFHIEPSGSGGWNTIERANDRVADQRRRTEWHRVERDLARFAREIEKLHQQGWRDA